MPLTNSWPFLNKLLMCPLPSLWIQHLETCRNSVFFVYWCHYSHPLSLNHSLSLALWFTSKVTSSHKASHHCKCVLCNYIKIHYRNLFILHFSSTSSPWETLYGSACKGSSPWRKITVNPAAQPAPAAPASHPSAWLSGRHSYLIC